MIAQEITYFDFNDEKCTETAYFHISQAELISWNEEVGDLQTYLQTAIGNRKDPLAALRLFEELVRKSYGSKTEDGKRFIKDSDKTEEFISSPAFDALFSKIAASPEASQAFSLGILPRALSEQVKNAGIIGKP